MTDHTWTGIVMWRAGSAGPKGVELTLQRMGYGGGEQRRKHESKKSEEKVFPKRVFVIGIGMLDRDWRHHQAN